MRSNAMFSALNGCGLRRVPFAACVLGARVFSFGCQKPALAGIDQRPDERIQASILDEQPKPNRFIGAKLKPG